MTSVVCIALPINRADDLSAGQVVVGFSVRAKTLSRSTSDTSSYGT
jgi:hypothetical protein